MCSKNSLNKTASTHDDNEFTLFLHFTPSQRTIRGALNNFAATAKNAAVARANELPSGDIDSTPEVGTHKAEGIDIILLLYQSHFRFPENKGAASGNVCFYHAQQGPFFRNARKEKLPKQ
jgi:hypothetical protein